ncbi:hypothetical protein OPV22_019559 [Ensete ventricosum]|uniref:Oleosin n=1 Tax=Ensete ventricosum TaxID=4639 RepID=A0AAV8QJF5_ENSVE|nr:hypothetical protein OPV22_019559 [Ensete ventricosum]RZR99529.1 hypothetical protein BHM03_00029086 [Ensete ventricosum]
MRALRISDGHRQPPPLPSATIYSPLTLPPAPFAERLPMEPNPPQSPPVSADAKLPRRGQSLVKKAAVAAAIVAFAPVVIPSLALLFALALALSVPSAIYLTSFACTEKLMRCLLVRPEQAEGNDMLEEDRSEEMKEGEAVAVGDGTLEDERPPEEAPGEEKKTAAVVEETGDGVGEDEVDERRMERAASDDVHTGDEDGNGEVEVERDGSGR